MRFALKTNIVYALLISAFAFAPAVVALAWRDTPPTFHHARQVQLVGPIRSFSQTGDKIEIRLVAPNAERRRAGASSLIVRSDDPAAPGEMRIPLHNGQTYLSRRLTTDLARATALVVYLDDVQTAAR